VRESARLDLHMAQFIGGVGIPRPMRSVVPSVIQVRTLSGRVSVDADASAADRGLRSAAPAAASTVQPPSRAQITAGKTAGEKMCSHSRRQVFERVCRRSPRMRGAPPQLPAG
jgi:hypothetical protein